MDGAVLRTGADGAAPRVEPAKVIRRLRPAGVAAGARLTRVAVPGHALALTAPALQLAEQRLVALVGNKVDVVETIAAYLVEAGGKRLRPMMVALGAGAVGYTGPLDGLMCAGELIHLGSLLHDDVVDLGLLRRGRPSAPVVYGNAASILTGDFCLARAVLLAAEEGGHRAVTALAAAVTSMAEGEVLQLQQAGDLNTSRALHLDMVDRKSAALLSWCAAAGAYTLEDEHSAEALARFGRAVGIAFQITDDVLDYLPETGKMPGADLRERKVTLPLIHAMAARPELRARLARAAPEPDELPALIEEVRATGALDLTLDEARARVADAQEALDGLPDGPHRRALAELSLYLVERCV